MHCWTNFWGYINGCRRYISVKSQEDIEKADLAIEAKELSKHPQKELDELTQIYISRGLSKELAQEVALQLTTHDALGAHARDEIGIHENTAANPVQAALSSAASFSFGAFFPPWLYYSARINGLYLLS